MDNDDEMMVQLFTKEHNVEAIRRQHQQLILTSMLRVRRPFFVVPRCGGSKPGRRNINRHRQAGTMLLDVDYFNDDATHSPKVFRRRFRMKKEFFLKIVYGVGEYDKYFIAKQDCTSLWGFTLIQKCTAAMRYLAYRAPPDTFNDYLRMTESTCIETLYSGSTRGILVSAVSFLRRW
nr:uncharacterized protein LOC127315263 [Lolium perenne]